MRTLLWLLLPGIVLAGCSIFARREPAPTPVQAQIQAVVPPGKMLFEFWCLPCHGAGSGHAGTQAIERRLGIDHAVLMLRNGLTPEYVTTIVRNGFQMMPPFRPTEISDKDLQELAAYVAAGGKPQ